MKQSSFLRLCQGVTFSALASIFFTTPASATIVEIQTSLGNFEVNLYDDKTPLTVANFLAYMEAEAYKNNFFHRSVPGFVVQGGGFQVINNKLSSVDTPWSPKNEPVFSNVRGTIAMAKLGGDANSATSQWFINLKDNSQGGAALDTQNGGFTVFGQVIGDGMAVVDAIAALETYNIGAGGTATPLRGDPQPEEFTAALAEYLVVIENIIVTDASPTSAVALTRPLTTKPKKKKGGAPDELVLLILAGLLLRKIKRH